MAIPSGTIGSGLRATINQAMAEPGHVLVITGAGISAESGIPTYRGAGGLWTEEGSGAMEMATAGFYATHPDQSWKWYLERRATARAAQPNPAHEAIARLEETLGDRFRLVTQNVDRLHVRAGNTLDRTIEIHGHLEAMRCWKGCEGIVAIPENGSDFECSGCGGPMRPHILWFDEFYTEEEYRVRTAEGWAIRAALVITIGSSGTVPISGRLAGIARRSGAALIDVNPEDGHLRRLALGTARGGAIAATACDAVPELVDLVIDATMAEVG